MIQDYQFFNEPVPNISIIGPCQSLQSDASEASQLFLASLSPWLRGGGLHGRVCNSVLDTNPRGVGRGVGRGGGGQIFPHFGGFFEGPV